MKINCGCGSEVEKKNYAKHLKSKKHLKKSRKNLMKKIKLILHYSENQIQYV